MYKLWKRVISLTLSLALLVPLAACGGGLSPDDATPISRGSWTKTTRASMMPTSWR